MSGGRWACERGAAAARVCVAMQVVDLDASTPVKTQASLNLAVDALLTPRGLRTGGETCAEPEQAMFSGESALLAPGTAGEEESEPGPELLVPLPCHLYTSPSPRDATLSRMPSSA